MNQKRFSTIFIYILLTIIFLAPRLPKIDSFVTLDEPSWLSQGANYYYALGQREFENTVYEYQPAVTTMSIIALSMHLYFPEYRGLGQGYLDYEKGTLDPFMFEHGKNPLTLLTYARTTQILVLLFLFLVLYFLLQKFFQKYIAAFILIFASLDPFYLSQMRLMNHEGMVSLFVLISLTSLSLYLFKENKILFLMVSGVAAGFAQLTKSSSIAMLVGIGFLLLINFFQERKQGWGKNIFTQIKTFTIWLACLALTYFIFWPGMWVAPGKMLYEVFGNAFSFAFQGARLKVTEELDVTQFSLNTRLEDTWNIARILLYKTTPITWLGFILGFIFPLNKKINPRFALDLNLVAVNRLFVSVWLVSGIAFIILFGIAQGRNSPHYILTSYLSFNLIAGLGWFYALQWISSLFNTKQMQIHSISLITILLLQTYNVFSTFPYYFTYRNPILYAMGWYNEFPHFPYGEGLEIAAQFLAEQPDAKNSVVFSYYSRGCFSYFYPGQAISFRPYYADGEHNEDLLNNLNASDYLIVYYANQGQLRHYDNFLQILSAVEPFHIVWMNDYEYIRVYKVEDFSLEVITALEDL
jgi:hypothetical protein